MFPPSQWNGKGDSFEVNVLPNKLRSFCLFWEGYELGAVLIYGHYYYYGNASLFILVYRVPRRVLLFGKR